MLMFSFAIELSNLYSSDGRGIHTQTFHIVCHCFASSGIALVSDEGGIKNKKKDLPPETSGLKGPFINL